MKEGMQNGLVRDEMLIKAARRFQLLGEPVRLDILNNIQAAGEMNVQELIDATLQNRANISKHLRLLATEGMVSRRKDGLYAYYSISDPSLAAICLLVCGQIRNEEEVLR